MTDTTGLTDIFENPFDFDDPRIEVARVLTRTEAKAVLEFSGDIVKTLAAGAQGEAVRWIVDARFKAEPGYKSGGGVSAIVDTQQKADAEEARLLAFDRTESVTVTPLYATPAQPDTGDVAALREALEECQRVFADYAEMHRHKLTQILTTAQRQDVHRKINRNRDMSDMCLAALSKPNAQGAPEDGGA